ncbi:MAG: transposase [Planctomycetes bacterium]|nr:transposase [Planctomycetota bacterium]
MTLYKNKYRIESTRLKDWDYSRDGYYFVTICTQDKKCLFGDVIDEKMRLSAIGEMVADEWQKTPQIRKKVSLDTWIIMPNHVHGIVVINNDVETPRWGVSSLENAKTSNDSMQTPSQNKTETSQRDVSTIYTAQNDKIPNDYMKTLGEKASVCRGGQSKIKSGSLGAIIGQFKKKKKKRTIVARHDFSWQTRFFDHIIRNEKSLNKIREYIINNPLKWELDKNNPANLFM